MPTHELSPSPVCCGFLAYTLDADAGDSNCHFLDFGDFDDARDVVNELRARPPRIGRRRAHLLARAHRLAHQVVVPAH
jgi:hypothetical protein